MTISPIVGAMLHQTVAEPVAPQASSAAPVPASPDVPVDFAPAPGTHAAPVSPAEDVAPARAELVSGDTPGDDIIAGLNKRWGRMSRALDASAAAPSRLEGDETASVRGDASGWSAVGDDAPDPAGARGRGLWSPVEDGDDDAHALRMSDAAPRDEGRVEAEEAQIRDIDGGGALMLQLSKGVQGVESSIKTLVTGQ